MKKRHTITMSLLCTALATMPLAAQTPIFSEGFSYNGGGPGTQYQTGLPVRHSGVVPNWTKTGDGHAVVIDGNIAVSLYSGNASGSVQPDTLTYDSDIAANDAGATYRVAFEAGPSVWAHHSQITTAEDGLVIEILRGDGSVLASYDHLPGAWQESQELSPDEFTYTGDGSGPVTIRVRTLRTVSNTFSGAIDNLEVYLAPPPTPIFSEGFSYNGGGPGTQYQTGLPVRHSGVVPNWTKTGDGHAVVIDGNIAVSLYSGNASGSVQPDTLTYDSDIAANDAGATYRVAFEAGPSVWAHHSQITTAEDGLVIEILRGDGSVLASYDHLPGAWQESQELSPDEFTYTGDGSGPVTIRVRTLRTVSNTFSGAIDNLEIFRL